MITIEADEADIAAALEALAPGAVKIESGVISAKIAEKRLTLSNLKLELHTELTYDQLQADVVCRLDGGHAHIEAEIQ